MSSAFASAGDLVGYAEQASAFPDRISSFLATGMLLNVLATGMLLNVLA